MITKFKFYAPLAEFGKARDCNPLHTVRFRMVLQFTSRYALVSKAVSKTVGSLTAPSRFDSNHPKWFLKSGEVLSNAAYVVSEFFHITIKSMGLKMIIFRLL